MAGGTIRVAQPCGCAQESFMGKKREKLCSCGNLFEKPDVVEARRDRQSRPRRRSSEPKRDWADARAKVEEEACCRICKKEAGSGRPLEAAHILGREHDQPRATRPSVLYVDPDRIIPACGPYPAGCHGLVHQKAVDILPVLTIEEQIRALKDAGGLQHARTLLAPVETREEVASQSLHKAGV